MPYLQLFAEDEQHLFSLRFDVGNQRFGQWDLQREAIDLTAQRDDLNVKHSQSSVSSCNHDAEIALACPSCRKMRRVSAVGKTWREGVDVTGMLHLLKTDHISCAGVELGHQGGEPLLPLALPRGRVVVVATECGVLVFSNCSI